MLKCSSYTSRRMIPVVLMLLVGFCLLSAPAFGETLDIASMDYDSLLALKQKVDLEFHSRPEAAPQTLKPGQYTVGSDIKVGKYYVIFAEPGSRSSCDYLLFTDKSTYTEALKAPVEERRKNLLSYGSIRASDRSVYFDLQEGNYIVIDGASLKIGVNDFDDEEYFTYTTPEGTVVPRGTYTVGEEIPAGSYTAYSYDLNGASIYIYSSAKALADDQSSSIGWDADMKISLGINDDTKSSIFKLSEGNVVIVKNAVVMKKNAAFNFGD